MFLLPTPPGTVNDVSLASSESLASSRNAFFAAPKRSYTGEVNDGMRFEKRARSSIVPPNIPGAVALAGPNTSAEWNATFTHSINLRAAAHLAHLADFHNHLVIQSVSEFAPSRLSRVWHLRGMSSDLDTGEQRTMRIVGGSGNARSISHREAYPLQAMNARLLEDQMTLLRDVNDRYSGAVGGMTAEQAMDIVEAIPAQIMALWTPAGVCIDEAGSRVKNGSAEKIINCVTRGRMSTFDTFQEILPIGTSLHAVLRYVPMSYLAKRKRVYFKENEFIDMRDIEEDTNNSLRALKELGGERGVCGVFMFVPYGRPGYKQPSTADLEYVNMFGDRRTSLYIKYGHVIQKLPGTDYLNEQVYGNGTSGKSNSDWSHFNSYSGNQYWENILRTSKQPMMEITVQVHANTPTTKSADFTVIAQAEREHEMAHGRSMIDRFAGDDELEY